MKILLLVDDDRFLRRATERVLIRAGHQVISISDGEEGWRVAAEDRPDLILLDMMLPKVSGLDVLRRLKLDLRTQHIPVVVLSGLSQANGIKLLKEGATAYLEKSESLFAQGSALLIRTIEALSVVSSHSEAQA